MGRDATSGGSGDTGGAGDAGDTTDVHPATTAVLVICCVPSSYTTVPRTVSVTQYSSATVIVSP